jgi:hypothetical protein
MVELTKDQERELIDLIGVGTRAARLTTESVIGTDKQIAAAAKDLIDYIRETYPHGPLHLKKSLDSIVKFCHLRTFIVAEYGDKPPN